MHIVHLEDEAELAEMLRLALITLEPDLKVKYFSSWEKAVDHIEKSLQYIDLFVVDVRLPGKVDGLEAVRRLREMGSNVPVFLTSAFERPDRVILNELDCIWVAKPWYMIELTQQLLTSVKGSYEARFNRQHQHTHDLGDSTHVVAADIVQRVVEDHTKPGFVTSLDPLGKSRELMIEIHGIIEQRGLTENFSLILGRSDPSKNFVPDIDLTLYAPPKDSGISRRHVRLHIEGDNLYVTDLGSTNGTFLRGERLRPDVPTPIYRGDELVLGKLALKVLFR